MARDSEGRAVVTSLDGTRTIAVDELDQLFDDGSDEIDDFIDRSEAYRRGDAPDSARVSLGVPRHFFGRLHAEADPRGLKRDALLAEWVVEPIRNLDDPHALDHAAE